ncbi:gamma-aminobutyric acid receptor subunit delta-like isoform X1 [Acropora millepora]|uniref:gamma-aminobutyric acid receptor subunit delta-like isoform X1 n=1 Tax=Acropora millepora TaxID=45264 RepID=UPI0010FC7BEE|nr:gamma-aminobutyric acid receptor subunit delta-like isoform X1 [Acropora millepora]
MSYFVLLCALICIPFQGIATERHANTTTEAEDQDNFDENSIDSVEREKEWIRNSSKIFEKLMKNYDPSMAPFVPGKPVKVDLVIEILAFGEVNEAHMDYGLDIYLFQVWDDVRLAQDQEQERRFYLSGKDIKKIWTPDTYFMNAKQTDIKDVVKENQMVYIMPSGIVVHSSRITLTVACHMQLRMYPFDRQKCALVIESFSLPRTKLVYRWANLIADKCEVEVYDDAMAQHEYKGVKLGYNFSKPAGQFSNLYATFVFDRRTSYTILQVYVPSYMIVLLSFMALWLPQNAVPARVSLGITTVLTIVYFLATVNSNMPRVSYMKAIDYHLFVSFGFVFAIMLEYVILLNVKHRKKRKQHFHKKFELTEVNNHSREEQAISNSYGADFAVRYRMATGDVCADEEALSSLPLTQHRNELTAQSLHPIDRLARVFFPASYATFVVVYWVVCIVFSPKNEELDLC